MAVLMKEIIPVGPYLVNSPQGRIRRSFDEPYLRKVAATANSMIAAGLKIPAPFGHHKEANPVTEIDFVSKPTTPFTNAGYWSYFTVEPNDKGIATLKGIADISGSKEDSNSPYFKALNSAKEVSMSMRDEYTDGLERKWQDAIIHVALVNHAVVPDQKDFEEVPGGAIINMSMMDDDDVDYDPTMVTALKAILKSAVNIVLPDSCTAKTFMRDLLVAASQVKANRPEDGQTLEPVPIYMSINGDTSMLTEVQASALVATKAVNPATKLPFTMADFGFTPKSNDISLSALQAQLTEKDSKLAQMANLLKALAQNTTAATQSAIQSRINKLIAAGTITKEYADAMLQPKVAFEMSVLSTGEVAPHQLEITLSALEAIPARNPAPELPAHGGYLQPKPYGDNSSMDQKSMDEAINELMSFVQ